MQKYIEAQAVEETSIHKSPTWRDDSEHATVQGEGLAKRRY